MKNLKKLLAVVLVVAMALTFMATASAANVEDYTDFDDVTYIEAVDVFTALGFLAGMGDGSFDPTGLVTRAQAAKIITYMLIGSARADALTTATYTFTDTVNHWAAAHIEYCAALGIINGRGDGTFDPEGNVTAIEFGKMLLCAVGYGAKDEYTGANWAMKTLADAQSKGILTLAVDYTAAATREECSFYGLNAYWGVQQVTFNSTTNSYQSEFSTTTNGTVNDVQGSLAAQQGVGKSNNFVQNGITMYNWIRANGAFVAGPYSVDNIIGTSTDGTTLARLTNPFDSKFIATAETPAAPGNPVYYLNGTPSTAAAINAINGRGVVITFVNTDGDADAETVAAINKTVTILSAAPVVNAVTGNVTIPDVCINELGTKVDGHDGLVAGDVILWYADQFGVIHIEKADSITGTMTAYNGVTATATVNDATMSSTGLVSSIATNNINLAAWAGLGMYNTDSTFYLDDNGSVVHVKSNVAVPVDKYGLVLDYQHYGAFANSAQVKLFTQEGVLGIYDVAANTLGVVPDQGPAGTVEFPGFNTTGTNQTAYLVRYTENATGQVNLFLDDVNGTAIAGNVNTGSTLTADHPAGGTTVTDGTAKIITADTPVFYFDTTLPLGAGNYPAVTTGFANTNFASGTGGTAEDISYGITSAGANHLAGVLFEFSATVSATTGYAYMMSTTTPNYTLSPSGGVNYYDYYAYKLGEVQTSKLTSMSAAEFNLYKDGPDGVIDNEWTDANNDQTIDNGEWTDASKDGVAIAGEFVDGDADGWIDAGEWEDLDGDFTWVGDEATEWTDTNANGVIDFGEWVDLNGNNTMENEWIDANNDGVVDAGEWIDAADGFVDPGETRAGLYQYTTDASGNLNTTSRPGVIVDVTGVNADVVTAIDPVAKTFTYNGTVVVVDANTQYFWITQNATKTAETGIVANPLAAGYNIEWILLDSVTNVAKAVYYYI